MAALTAEMRDAARLLAGQGVNCVEIAKALGCTYNHVYAWAKSELVVLKSSHFTPEQQARNARMAYMYRQGLTLAKIGEENGLTRERVRQILTQLGVTANDGGASIHAAARQERKKRAQKLSESAREARWGVDIELCRELRANGTIKAYEQQRGSAGDRGLAWTLTFSEWFAIWQASGKMHLRGRGKGRYCMSRIKDTGGYSLGNVHIQLATENSREAVSKWKGKTKPIKGVYCIYPGREMAWLAKVGKKRLGYFASAELAGAAREAFITGGEVISATPIDHAVPEAT